MFGALSSNFIADAMGRRWAFRVSALVFIIGIIIESASYSYTAIVVGRAFVGLGVGFGLAIDPVYIGEISTAAHRGQLVTWSEIAINVGIVLGFASGLLTISVDDDMAWRIMFAVGLILPCLVIFFSTFVMPESPRWLVLRDRDTEAKKVLMSAYPKGYDVDEIVQKIKEDITTEAIAKKTIGWKVFFSPKPALRRMILVGVGTAVAQQAVGIDAIQYFLVYILNELGIGQNSRFAQTGILIALGIFKLSVIFVAGYLLDRKGRRPLFFMSLIGMALSLLLVSLGLFLGSASSERAAVFGLAFYLAFYSLGMGPGAWLIPAEVFSTTIRAKAMSVATFMNRATATIVSSTFLSVAKAMTFGGFFIMMAAVCLIVLVWMYIYVPETKGRSLEDMARYFGEITGDRSIFEDEDRNRENNAAYDGVGVEESSSSLSSAGATGVRSTATGISGVGSSLQLSPQKSSELSSKV